MIYYVYRITHILERKHYYGYRGTTGKPENDLGKKYFSSSSDTQFKKLQKTNPALFRYKIINVYSEKEPALRKEIKLHKKFDVKKHPSFYNLANQTNEGFCANNKGRPGLKGDRNGMVREIKIYDNKGELKYTSCGSFKDFCKENKLPETTFRKSYYNGGVPILISDNMQTWARKKGFNAFIGWYALYGDVENHSLDKLKLLTEYELKICETNKEKLSVVHNGNSYNTKDIKIYDHMGVAHFENFRSLIKVCENNNLPKSALSYSVSHNGMPIFQTKYGRSRAIKEGFEKFIGWYAKVGKAHSQEEYQRLVSTIIESDNNVQSKKTEAMTGQKRNGKKINIYDSTGCIIYETDGNFKEVCEKYNLPFCLGKSHRNNGKPIFVSETGIKVAIRNCHERYIGWYAKKVE